MTATNVFVNSGTDVQIRAAIATLTALGSSGGTVLLGPNQFNINATINVPSNITIVGSGWNSTQLLRKADVPIFSIFGTNTNTRVHRVTLSEMQLHGAKGDVGNAFTKPIVSMAYADTCWFEHLEVQGANTLGWKTVDSWDSTWMQCRFDDLGGAEGSGLPAHIVYAADPTVSAGQFGRTGGESSNDCRYIDCTWESFRCGGMWINVGGGALGIVATQMFLDCKLDASETPLGSFFRAETVNILTMRNFDCSLNGAGAGFSDTPYNIFEFAQVRSLTIDGLDILTNGGSLGHSQMRSLMRFDSTTNPHSFVTGIDTAVIRNVRPQLNGTSRPSLGYLIEFVGSANRRFTLENNHMIGNPFTDVAMYGGTMPTVHGIGRMLATKAGTPTDTLYGDTQVPGLLTNEGLGPVLDTTANKVWFRFPDGTWRGVVVA